MFTLFLQAIWKILLWSLVLGAGLPVVYAFGIRSLALGSGGETVADTRRNPVGTVLAGACFVIVVLGVAVGLTYIIAAGQGKMLSFHHVYPTIVPKS